MGRRLAGAIAVVVVLVGLLVVPAAGRTEARSFTVTPNLDLVQDQSVNVSGQGWGAHSWLFLFVCREGEHPSGDCEYIRDLTASAQGRFNRSIEIDVVVDTESTPVDCRVEACDLLVVDDLPTGNERRVALDVDPASPPPPRHMVNATPAVDLVDGQAVHLTGTGLPTGSFSDRVLAIVQCVGAVPNADDCDWSTYEMEFLATAGTLDTTYVVSAILHPEDGGPTDCRLSVCTVAVLQQDDGLSDAGLVTTVFDPAGVLRPPPTLTITPGGDRRDGDLVFLEGDGFEPGGEVSIAQCLAGAPGYESCRLDPGYFDYADADGHVEGWFGLHAVIELYQDRADCRAVACSIVMSEGMALDTFVRYDEASTPFVPDAPLLDPQVTVTPSTGLEDGSVVTVSGTGFHPPDGVSAMLCPAGADWFDRCSFDIEQSFDVTDVEAAPRRERPGRPIPTEETVPGRRLRLSATAEAASDQDFSGEMVLRAEFTNDYGRHVDCREEACEIMVHEHYNESLQVHVPVEFARADDGGGGANGPVAAAPGFTG